MSAKPIIYMPMEISSRELESRLLLARKLCEKGFQVVLGKKKQLIEYMEVAKPGIFLSIWGAHRNFKKLYSSLSEKGFLIATMDEEGLITLSDKHYLINSIDVDTLEYVSNFFCWGPKQVNLLQSYCKKHACETPTFLPTGNVRMDLLRDDYANLFQTETNKIKTRFPDCLLVISSFGFARHFQGADNYYHSLVNSGVIWNDFLNKNYQRYLSFQKENAGPFISLLEYLCLAFPEKQIVYRPHPSEKNDDLHSLENKYDNLFIDSSYSIIAWLRSVSYTIFHYCTTGPEAQIIGCRNIAYRPYPDNEIESDVPYRNTNTCSNAEQIIDLIRNSGHDIATNLSKDINFEAEISGLNSSSAADNITSCLLDLADIFTQKQQSTSDTSLFAKLKFVLKNRFARETKYVLHKYGLVNVEKINHVLRLLSFAGHENCQAKQVAKHIFLIRKI